MSNRQQQQQMGIEKYSNHQTEKQNQLNISHVSLPTTNNNKQTRTST